MLHETGLQGGFLNCGRSQNTFQREIHPGGQCLNSSLILYSPCAAPGIPGVLGEQTFIFTSSQHPINFIFILKEASTVSLSSLSPTVTSCLKVCGLQGQVMPRDSSSVCVEVYSRGIAKVKSPSFFNPEIHCDLEDLQGKKPKRLQEKPSAQRRTQK